jgi:RNA polymerase sigma factor (sigma-70 family)
MDLWPVPRFKKAKGTTAAPFSVCCMMAVALRGSLKVVHRSMDEAEMAALMRAAQHGDAAGYARLLTAVTPIVRRIVARRWTGTDEADDVVQDVLLSLHQVRHTYDPGRPFMPWLLAIARNRLADVQRRQVRRAHGEIAVDVLPETFSDDETKEPIDRMADAEALSRALADLPPRQREAVELLRLREMSLKEASAASGMSIAALKVSMHRAMKALRTVLTK